MARARLVALEFTVADLVPCLALFEGVMGAEATPTYRHPTIDADVVQIDAGEVVVNLLCPTDTGDGVPLANPEPRLSQLNFYVEQAVGLSALRESFVAAGGAVVERDESLFYIDSQMVDGVLGADATLVFSCEEVPGREG